MGLPKDTPKDAGKLAGGNEATISAQLLAKARADPATLLQELGSRLEGLSQAEADARLKQVGPNEIAGIQRFILFIGPISSIFDYLTFFILLTVFKAGNSFAPCWHAGICHTTAALLAAAGDHAAVLRHPNPVGEDLLLPEVWRLK